MRKSQTISHSLSSETFATGLDFLAEHDPDLARILTEIGQPPLWSRAPGFPTLIYIILEQQVSLASAKAAYNRLLRVLSPLTPEGFLRLDDAILKTIGFSRQKAIYGRSLAQSIVQGELDLEALKTMEDQKAKAELMTIKGIGPWTADIYLLIALRRPDIWPGGDLALQRAIQEVKQLDTRPSSAKLEEIGQRWKPWRAVAARLLWHYYLHGDRPG